MDHLIPFLPLDQSHVRECIKVSAGERSLTEKDMNAILNQLSYWPKAEKLFSTTGCKRVEAKVQLYLEEMYDDL